MAIDVKHISETEFKLSGHYCYLDINGNWIAQPPIDSSETNKSKLFTKIIEQKNAPKNRKKSQKTL